MIAFNLAQLFEANVDAFPDRLAVVSGATRLSYRDLDERGNRLAHHWQAHGIGAGDHIGLCLYNGHAYLECMLAAWKLGARTINLNFRYAAPELRYVFEDAKLVGVITEPDLLSEVEKARTEAMHLCMVWGPAYEAALAASSPVRDFPTRPPDDLVIIYTGGTTGMPRGVMWRHEDLFFAALQGGNPGGDPITVAADLAPRMRDNGGGIHILTAPPLIHGSSQLACWIALLNGGRAVLIPGRHFDPEAVLDAVDAEQVHTLNIVGDAMALPLVETLAAHPGRWNLGDLLVVASAGAVLSGSVREGLESRLPNAMALNNFGASETGHQGAAFYDEGKPMWVLDERHTTVLDENLEPVRPGSGVVGKIARFGHIPLGYFGDAVKTAQTFVVKNGVRYVMPGDLATIAEDGSVVFLGRGSVCINSGGEKVFAEEVEEALKSHPAVFDAIVVGVPDPRWGQRVEALITLRTPTPDLADILAFCRSRIAGHKVPKHLWVVPDLNRQPSGKPDYRWAQAEAIARGTTHAGTA